MEQPAPLAPTPVRVHKICGRLCKLCLGSPPAPLCSSVAWTRLLLASGDELTRRSLSLCGMSCHVRAYLAIRIIRLLFRIRDCQNTYIQHTAQHRYIELSVVSTAEVVRYSRVPGDNKQGGLTLSSAARVAQLMNWETQIIHIRNHMCIKMCVYNICYSKLLLLYIAYIILNFGLTRAQLRGPRARHAVRLGCTAPRAYAHTAPAIGNSRLVVVFIHHKSRA